jgi:polar amino acid transport system substrate-binding protein
MKISKIFILLSIIGIGLVSTINTIAQDLTTPPKQVRLGVRLLDPFVFKKDNTYDGFSYELWSKISKDQNLANSEVKVYNSANELLKAVEDNQVDVGISALSITQDREERVDFSTSMFNSGLSIMVTSEAQESSIFSIFDNIKTSIFNKDFAALAAIMGILSFILSNIVYFLEIRKKSAFANVDNYFEGMIEAFWWGVTALFGQQDRQPISKTGRFISILWMIFGVLFLSFFTAQVTSNLTAQKLNSSIAGISDLKDKTSGTIGGSTAEKYLINANYKSKKFTSILDAATALKNKEVDAVVFDSPALEYFVKSNKIGSFTMAGGKFTDENYGIAMPSKSELRKNVNLSLLRLQESGEYSELVKKYFGEK